MPENIRIISARVSLRFKTDQVELDRLHLPDVMGTITQRFQFEKGVNPIAVDGARGIASPNLTFANGVYDDGEKSVVVREIGFSATSISIHVVGESECLMQVYRELRGLFSEEQSPIHGEYIKKFDHSEISAKLAFPYKDVVPPWLRGAVQSATNQGDNLVATLTMTLLRPDERYPGDGFPVSTRQWVLSPRVDSEVDDRVFYSAAPLTTDEHLAYLARIEETFLLSGSKKE